MSNKGPLDGVTVIDLTAALAGPYATLMLAGLGARVIKIESPGAGDIARENSPYLGADGLTLARTSSDDTSVSLMARCRGKESVTINLKAKAGLELFFKLVEHADVVVENFGPGVTERLGIGYDRVRAVNPKIVYTSITGFGTSNGRGDKAMDATIQALSGIMMTMGQSGEPPVRIGVPIADLTAPLFAVIGTVAAVLSARQTGKGQFVDVSMLGALASLVSAEMIDAQIAVGFESRTGSYMPRLAPFGTFECIDGWFAISAPTDAQALGVFRSMGREDLYKTADYQTRNARAANADRLHAVIADWSRPRARDHVLSLLRKHGVPSEPVLTPAEAIRDQGVLARGEVVPLTNIGDEPLYGPGIPIVFSDTKAGLDKPAPRLGEHTDAILQEFLGLELHTLAHLHSEGTI